MGADPAAYLRGARPGDLAPDGEPTPSLWTGELNQDQQRYEISVWDHAEYATDEDKERLIESHLPQTVAFGEITSRRLSGQVYEYPEDGEPVVKVVEDRTYRVRVEMDDTPPGHGNAIIESDDAEATPPPPSIRRAARIMLVAWTRIVYRKEGLQTESP